MFCIKCGKTIYPGEERCAHCGTAVGGSRFTGISEVSAYTSVQDWEPAPRKERDEMDFTRTSYMSEGQVEQHEEEDVTRRTVYRPVLRSDEAEGHTSAQTWQPPEEEEPDAPEEKEEAPSEAAEAKEAENEEAAAKDETAPKPRNPVRLTPVKLSGISPTIRARMAEMDANPRPAGKNAVLRPFGRHARIEDVEDTEDEEEIEEEDTRAASGFKFKLPHISFSGFGRRGPEEDDDEDEEIEETEGEENEEEEPSEGIFGSVVSFVKSLPETLKGLSMRTVGIAAAVVLVLVIGILVVGNITADKAKIDGVTYDVYAGGIALLEKNCSDEYFDTVSGLYVNDYAQVEPHFAADLDAVNALLPEKPAENDQIFVDTVYVIQQSIETTATVYAFSGVQTDLTADYNSDRARVQSSIEQLKNATTVEELLALQASAVVTITDQIEDTGDGTGEEETEVTSQYVKLTKGMMNSNDVMLMQQRLIDLGYLQGDADGSFGSKTEVAVKRFQKAVGQDTDGIATPELQELLFSDKAPVRKGSTPAEPTAAPAPQNEDGEGEEV